MPQPIKVLIVEDSPADAELVQRALRRAGFEPTAQVVDTEDAYLEALRSGFDLVLSDYQLPQFSGLRALELLRRKGLNLPFIIVSGTIGEETAVAAMRLGATDYLLKDRLARLESAVSQALEAGRMRAEQQRAESRLRLQGAALAATVNAIVITDPKGTILWTNPSFSALTGYTATEAVGQNMRLLKSGKHGASFYKELWRTILIGQTWRGELINRRKDGSLYIGEQSITPIRPDGGEITHFIGIMQDVTTQKRAEEDLRRSHAQLQQMVDFSPAVLYALRLEGEKIIPYAVSENVTRLLGFTVEETLSYAWWLDQLHPDDRERAVAGLSEMLEKGASRTEYRIRKKGGGYQWVEDNRRLMRDSAGAPAEIRGVWTDIAERKHAEEVLRESELRFRQLAENIYEVFWMTDPLKKQMLYISPAYEKIWGRTCESLYADPKGWIDAIHPEDRERVLDAFKRQSEGTYDEDYRIVRPDGTVRWIHDHASPVRDADGKVSRLVGVAEDITDHRRLEEQFQQAQKMEAIGTLAGGIAHDFNNILTVIGGYTELLKETIAPDAEAAEKLQAVSLATGRATKLVRQILTFSRQEKAQRQPTRLAPVVDEAVKFLRSTIPVTIEISSSLAPDAPVVLGDATQIHQIIMNLGTNAWHAMKKGPGKLEVKLESFTVDRDMAVLNSSLRPGRYARLSVADSGTGMDKATVARIFEPFFTTKPVGEGTGLGLAVVHGIMQSHDGAITVYSEPGQGTAFHLYFPALESAVSEKGIEDGSIPRGHGERILYLDDELLLAKLGKEVLDRLGYAAEQQTNALEALELVRAEPKRFDLVITDQTMPGMTGIEFAREITSIRPSLPVVLTTGYTWNMKTERLREAGIRELLLKPATMQQLGTIVHQVLAQRNPK
jgi:PAS domain S-box-containing protein